MINQKRIKLLLSTAESMGLKPKVLTDYGLVSIEVNGKERYLFHKTSNPNDQMASWLAQNKHAARVVFARHGLPNIPFCVPANTSEAKNFLLEHDRIIVKPLKGSKSQGIRLVSNEGELSKVDLNNCILEKFIKGQEVRFLVVDGEVRAVHQKVYKNEINEPDTVQRVSLKKEAWDNQLVNVAVKSATVMGLRFTAVDFIVTKENHAYILEINSAPGIERFQEPSEGPMLDIMRIYLEQIIRNYTTDSQIKVINEDE